MNDKRIDLGDLKGRDSMTERHNISIKRGLWRRARLKAGLTPISRIIANLLLMWLNDEVKVDLENND